MSEPRQWIKNWKGIPIVAPSVALCVILGDFWGIFQVLEWGLIDGFFRGRPLEPIDERIAIVTIDETDLTEVGQWPFPDRTLAQLLAKIDAQQPRAIGIDLYRDLPVEPGHEELVQVFESSPHIIGVEKVIGTPVPPPPALKSAGQVAMSDMVLDADGKVRRALISAGTESGEIQLSLGVRVALMYLEPEQILPEAGDNHQVKIGKLTMQPLRQDSGGYVRGDTGGYQVLLNYRGADDRFLNFSMSDVLNNRITSDAFRDRIVLIGVTAPSLNDLFPTPYNKVLFAPPSKIAGVVIHANIASQILSGALEGRPFLKVWPLAAKRLWIGLWSFVGALSCWLLLEMQAQRKHQFFGRTFLAALGLAGSLVGGSYLAFCFGWVIPVASPLIAFSIAGVAIAFYHDREQLKITNQKLAKANAQLEDYSHTLERKVEERTQELEKAKKAALAASEAKSEFLSNMSHELRTPLNGILGYAQILQRDKSLGEKQLQGIDIISECGSYLLNLINEILDLSKIEARKMELNPKDFAFHSFLQSVSQICQIKAQEKDLHFELEEGTGLPPEVYTDEKRLRQVLINLLGNAIKFTDRGTVKLKVQGLNAKKQPRSQKTIHRIRFEIEDTGVGMTPEQLEKIFLPFEQVGDRDRRVEGTGLGLAIGQKIVQMFGSQLEVKSEKGIGTTFWFDLDLPSSTDSLEERPVEIANNIIGYTGERQKILVVDDRAENLSLLSDFLASLGFEISEAVNGKDALKKAVALQPDAIVADLLMPEMDGFEMIDRLRKIPGLQEIPALAISASAFESDKLRSLSAGYNNFLAKPIESAELLRVLQKYLSLEWIYEPRASEGQFTSTSSPTGVEEIDIPPKESLLRLYEAAKIGDIDAIEQEAIQLKNADKNYNEFATQILQLSADFEDQKIVEIIQPYIGEFYE